MSRKRAYYYPLAIYLLLLLMVWVGSFFADVVKMLSDGSYHPSSLISAEGLRWAVRTALPTLNAVPWGTVMLFVAAIGLLRGSGLTKVMKRILSLRRLTVTEWRALSFTLVAVACYGVLLYMSAASSWGLFRGVTDEPALSPIVQGWGILLFFGVLFASLVYGSIYGNYRSVMDVSVATADSFVLFVPALLALVPASGIVPCLAYTGVQEVSWLSWSSVKLLLYLLPFVYVAVLQLMEKDEGD